MTTPYPKIYSQLGGDAGIYQTVNMMIGLVNESMLDPMIRERATTLITGCKREPICEDKVLTNWTNRAIQFTRDPRGVEALHHPASFYENEIRQGKRPAGDCDDMAMYLAALLKSVGHAPMFVTIDRTGAGFSHVYVWSDGMELDPTLTDTSKRGKPLRILYFEI